MDTEYSIATAVAEDVEQIAQIEKLCFPVTEAAGKEDFEKRLQVFSDYFFVARNSRNEIVCVVDGPVTEEENLLDEMYKCPEFHKQDGKWQMIFGVETHPDYRRRGIASAVLNKFIERAKEEKRRGAVLTCKEHLIPYYQKFGFKDEGVSVSEHGGVSWHQMRLTF